MDKSPERLEYMTSRLNDLKIPFVRQLGIDGKQYDFSDVYSEELSIKNNGGPLFPNELGCAYSHRLALEKALLDTEEYSLILEDDVDLPKNFKIILEEEILKRDLGLTNWEYIAFNYPSVGIKYIRLWIFLLKNMYATRPTFLLYLKAPLYFLKFIGVCIFSFFEGMREILYKKLYSHGSIAKFYRPQYLAGCYLMNKAGIKKILSVNEKVVYPADRIQNVARVKKNLKLYAYVPLVVKQRRDKFKSTLNEMDLTNIMDVLQ
jgi:GR25 family glycosyltransferase involved in LPS biosynthesis